MSRLVRSFLLLAVAFSFGATSGSYAASVPVTSEPGLATLIPGVTQRNTCSPDFMEVLKNRAWEGAQRDITQNANIIPRPDSVLSLTCFDSWLDHLATYAANNFPGDPDESDGQLFNGLFTDWFIVFPDDLLSGIDPNFTEGFVLYALLEILVLDQLENVDSVTDSLGNAFSLALCVPLWGAEPKRRYLEDNFPGLMIGNRAKTQPATPAYSQISSRLDDNVSDGSNFNGCALMNQVWQRTKCYDFTTESAVYKAAYAGAPNDHDGFYTFEDYEFNSSISGDDYRTEANQCDAPSNDIIDFPSSTELLCQGQANGIPSLPALGGTATVTLLPPSVTVAGGGPTWTQAYNAANPAPGGVGAMDVYNNYLSTISGTTCAPPIKVGYIVNDQNNVTINYVDAVCPTPGCFFNPPTSIAGTGSCTY